MKRILAVLVIIVSLFGFSACGPTYTEMLSEALTLTDFTSLEVMPFTSVGVGVFEDYKTVHSNPTKIADMPLDITADSQKISENSNGFAEFIKETAKKYGFKNEFQTSYDKAASVEDAIEMLFAVTNETEGLSEAKALASNINDALKPVITEYLSAAAKAYQIYFQYGSKISDNIYNKLQQYSYCLPATDNPDAMTNAYTANSWMTESKRFVAGMLVIEASSKLIAALNGVDELTLNGEPLTIATPAGNIVFGTKNDDIYNSPEAFLIIDIAGNDNYNGSVAASISKTKPVSVVIDLAGNDIYDSTAENVPSQGAGIFGAGVLYDMSGDDVYKAIRASQGFGLVGVGALFDASGNDSYISKVSSQSSAYFGISALVDIKGDDSYYAYGYSQASAGSRAISLLVEKEGNDSYFVETLVQKGYEGMEYDLFLHVNGNWSQGCAAGNRSVSTVNRGLAGGIAGLIDLNGDDVYNGGVWVQGVGYWSGYGFLSDINGNDEYNSRYYSHSSVAHFGAAALIDIGGDDKHIVEYKDGVSAGDGAAHGFVWDRGVALFVDDGGNDIYKSVSYSFGVSWSEYDSKGYDKQDQSYAFFIETEGDDVYPYMADKSYGWGRGGFFFDLAGNEKYKNIFTANDALKTNVSGIFSDSDNNGYIAFWQQAREKFKI